ncbi:unnamed protein product [Commensalibacter communis]|uniref:DUF5677 domain-containing protein n=1 Tax=Commensalibacter communis TaxID=2972786 RepID=UPI0022FF8F3E|nr:DUF5677 domain-containing protein [Commensalibacter communis]CAI3933315.1 unnamed protein product [Commensalibacter communis]
MFDYSKLKAHKNIKGKLITPFNYALGDELFSESWFRIRLPEFLWIALILKYYGRKEGLEKLATINHKLYELVPLLRSPSLFLILQLTEEEQNKIYSMIGEIIDVKILSPLVSIYRYDQFPTFAHFFIDDFPDFNNNIKKIVEVLEATEFHQSDFTTDVRYIISHYHIISRQIRLARHIAKQIIDAFENFPILDHSDEKMRSIRPRIRAMESGLFNMGEIDHDKQKREEFINFFWDNLSKTTDCELIKKNIQEETENPAGYIAGLQEIFRYLKDNFTIVKPLDQKMQVLLGIAIFAYKRICEVYYHNLYHSISGRGSVRCIIECYMILKYLVLIENDKPTVWADYQFYGIGKTKLIMAKYREYSGKQDLSKSHVDADYLESLVHQYINEELLDVNFKYFDDLNIKKKFEQIDEKELYDLYYDYDSHFEHGLWGAIRESALLKCASVTHQFHCVPDVFLEQTLPSVWHDCKFVMNKLILFLNTQYEIPSELLGLVIDDKPDSE